MSTCPAENTIEIGIYAIICIVLKIDNSSFWSNGPNWNTHRVGWTVSGVFALVDTVLASILIYKHLRNYSRPEYQRYYVRIILMIPIYAIVSWLGYRFYRYSTYFRIILSFYEAIVISSFFILLLNFLGADHSVILTKPRRRFLCCCWTFDPKSWSYLETTKWSVLQFVIIAPILAVVQVILQLTHTLCPTSLSLSFGYSYVTIINTLSILTATTALIQFYLVIRKDISQFKPLWKFIAIKAVVFLMFYQELAFEILAHVGVIKATRYWTTSNIVKGLKYATSVMLLILVLCALLLLFFVLDFFAYPYRDFIYQHPKMPFWSATKDSFNVWDLYQEAIRCFHWVWQACIVRPKYIRTTSPEDDIFDIHAAFKGTRNCHPQNLELTNIEEFDTDTALHSKRKSSANGV